MVADDGMASLTTILRLSQALVVALLVAFAGNSLGDARCSTACVAVHASQIAVAQATLASPAPTSPPPRTWRVHRRPSMHDLDVSELEADDELESDDELSPASVRPSDRIELLSRAKDVAKNRRPAPVSAVVSHWMPTGHPRGPPARRG